MLAIVVEAWLVLLFALPIANEWALGMCPIVNAGRLDIS